MRMWGFRDSSQLQTSHTQFLPQRLGGLHVPLLGTRQMDLSQQQVMMGLLRCPSGSNSRAIPTRTELERETPVPQTRRDFHEQFGIGMELSATEGMCGAGTGLWQLPQLPLQWVQTLGRPHTPTPRCSVPFGCLQKCRDVSLGAPTCL